MTTLHVPVEEPAEADVNIGQNVHAILWKRGIRQKVFAQQLGISDSVLSKRLRGTSAWSAQDVLDVSRLLGVEIAKLYEQVTVAKVSLQLAASNPKPNRTPRQSPVMGLVPPVRN